MSLASRASTSAPDEQARPPSAQAGQGGAMAAGPEARLAAALLADAVFAPGADTREASEAPAALLAACLQPSLGAEQHEAFLQELLACLSRPKGAAPAASVEATTVLLAGLADAAERGLGLEALTLALDVVSTLASAARARDAQLGQGGSAAAARLLASAGARAEALAAALSTPPSAPNRPKRRGADAAAAAAALVWNPVAQLCRLVAAGVAAAQAAGDHTSSDAELLLGSLMTARAALRDAGVAPLAALLGTVAPALAPLGGAWDEATEDGPGEGASLSGVADSADRGVRAQTAAVMQLLLGELAAAAEAADAVASKRRAQEGHRTSGSDEEVVSRPEPELTQEQALAVLACAVATAREAIAAQADAAVSSSAAAPASLSLPLPPRTALALAAACSVAATALLPHVRSMGAVDATRILELAAAMRDVGLTAGLTALYRAAHERLRAQALGLSPAAALRVLRAVQGLGWRPSLLLRPLLLPLLRQLRADEDAAETALFGDAPADGPAEPAAAWTASQVLQALTALATLGYTGSLAAPLAQFGTRALLRAHQAAEAGQACGVGGVAAQRLAAPELACLLWACVALRYRGAGVLRPLTQALLQVLAAAGMNEASLGCSGVRTYRAALPVQVLGLLAQPHCPCRSRMQVPPSEAPLRAVAQAVWAAARLGVVSARLVGPCGSPPRLPYTY
jgi:hypothetical protein